MNAWVYILRCCDGRYYTGSTSNIEKRLAEHSEGTYSGFTSIRLPVTLAFSQNFSTIEEAIVAERMIKGWSQRKKEALINSDFALLHKLAKCRNETSHENK
jgi:putative endonuclease